MSKSSDVSVFTSLSIAIYWLVLSSAAPEMIKGVRASSIRQESISSTIAY